MTWEATSEQKDRTVRELIEEAKMREAEIGKLRLRLHECPKDGTPLVLAGTIGSTWRECPKCRWNDRDGEDV
jgi:hypothetical protein